MKKVKGASKREIKWIKWFKAMIKDEHDAHKDYLRHGYPGIASDELRHEGIMRKALKRFC